MVIHRGGRPGQRGAVGTPGDRNTDREKSRVVTRRLDLQTDCHDVRG
jgi:hypothetical protein